MLLTFRPNANTVVHEKVGTATVVLVASGTGSVPFEKSGGGIVVFTTGSERGDQGASDARRSIRWLNRLRRRGTW